MAAEKGFGEKRTDLQHAADDRLLRGVLPRIAELLLDALILGVRIGQHRERVGRLASAAAPDALDCCCRDARGGGRQQAEAGGLACVCASAKVVDEAISWVNEARGAAAGQRAAVGRCALALQRPVRGGPEPAGQRLVGVAAAAVLVDAAIVKEDRLVATWQLAGVADAVRCGEAAAERFAGVRAAAVVVGDTRGRIDVDGAGAAGERAGWHIHKHTTYTSYTWPYFDLRVKARDLVTPRFTPAGARP